MIIVFQLGSLICVRVRNPAALLRTVSSYTTTHPKCPHGRCPEDDDSLEESLNDVREPAQQFGQVKDVALDEQPTVGDEFACILSNMEEASAGAKRFD